MEVLEVFKALSEVTRLRIIKLLEEGELCVCDIAAALGTSQPKVSFHLALLKEAGFLSDRRQGKWTHYSLEGSDMFRRFLMMAVFERTDPKVSALDRARLEKFRKSKAQRGLMPEGEPSAKLCCGQRPLQGR